MDSTPSPITWTQVGTSVMVLFIHGGEVLLGGRGYVDCGLFTLGEATLQSRAQNSKRLSIAPWISLPGQTLYSVSTVLASPQDNHQRQTKVIDIQAYALDDYCDVVLDAQAPGCAAATAACCDSWPSCRLPPSIAMAKSSTRGRGAYGSPRCRRSVQRLRWASSSGRGSRAALMLSSSRPAGRSLTHNNHRKNSHTRS